MHRYRDLWLALLVWVSPAITWALVVVVLVAGMVHCAHAQTIFANGFESGVPGGPPPCPPIPQGFRVAQKTWGQVGYGYEWPQFPSFLVPIGSWTLRTGSTGTSSKPIAGVLITSPIVMDGGTHKLDWVGAQPIPAAGYGLAQAALRLTVIVSECRADITAPCQATARSGALFYGRNAAQPECRFNPATPLWITWHFAQPDFDPRTNTCDPRNPSLGVKCDGNFGSR